MSVCICACQFYNRIPRQTIATVKSSCLAAGVKCEIVPDLCFMAARDRAALERIASCRAVLGCQSRALRSFFGDMTAPECIDLRATSLPDILKILSLPEVDPGNDFAYEELHSDWIPWFPVIDASRCIHCGKCVDFCMFGVYSINDGKVRVTQPESCKTDCPACSRICPQNAVIFPKSEEKQLNGSLAEPVKPSAEDNAAFRERLKHRKIPRLFREDEL